jgi:DNA-binding transcriptional LysR family regulator
MAAQLRSGQVDLALASQELPGDDLERIELFTEEVLLAVSLEHPLARHRRVTVAELVREPFVVTRSGQWQRALLDELFAETGRLPVIACEGDEPAAVRGLIAAGVGIGLLPTISRHTTQTPRVAWLHLDSDIARRTLRLYWHRERYLTAAARRFRDFADAQLRRRRRSHPD